MIRDVYIAGPMTGVPDWNLPAFFELESELLDAGFEVFNPASWDGRTVTTALNFLNTTGPRSHKWYMERDLPYVTKADAVCVLPGWRKSKGASVEVAVARGLGIPVLRWDGKRLAPLFELIGIMGSAGAGKDTVAEALDDAFGFERQSFAGKLRMMAFDLNAYINPHRRYKDALLLRGYESAKRGVDGFREQLQDLGVAARRNLGENVWVDALFDSLEDGGRYVIPDVRFLNEAEAIKAHGGELWRVDRPGVEAANDHVSEHEWRTIEPDRVIVNNGTLVDLQNELVEVMGEFWS